ncbi:MAG: tyrosine-type recombinase/integrase [Deltaproteobacteria bacterium]|nr:tyrosine-type recombinase/integrase [Deltaproteobacteria bacterium]
MAKRAEEHRFGKGYSAHSINNQLSVLHRLLEKAVGQLLLPGPEGGRLSNNTLNRWFTELSAEAGIRRISSHGARHTSGSSYALAGASQKLIATMLGHSDTDATARYTHIQVEATAPVVEARWARLCGTGGGQASR